jgi:hypothetical protein
MHANKLLVAALLGACGGDPPECHTPTIDASICEPGVATFRSGSTNPYYPLLAGSVAVLEGTEGGVSVRIERRVTGETVVIQGVTTRLLEMKKLRNGVLAEVTRNYFAETTEGTVCYFGEDVDEYENNQVSGHEGTWRAGSAGAKPGIIMPVTPRVGDVYFQELADDVAVDQGRVTVVDGTMTFAGMSYDNVITILDSDPLDDDAACAEETKLYAPGVGEVVDGAAMLISFTPGTAATAL